MCFYVRSWASENGYNESHHLRNDCDLQMPLHYDITVLCLRLCIYECHQTPRLHQIPMPGILDPVSFVWYPKPVGVLSDSQNQYFVWYPSLRGWQRKPWISRNEQGLLNNLCLTSTNKTVYIYTKMLHNIIP